MKDKMEKIAIAICDLIDKKEMPIEDVLGVLIDLIVVITFQAKDAHRCANLICKVIKSQVLKIDALSREIAEQKLNH